MKRPLLLNIIISILLGSHLVWAQTSSPKSNTPSKSKAGGSTTQQNKSTKTSPAGDGKNQSKVQVKPVDKNSKNNDSDIPDYPLLWEYPKMAIDSKLKKEYVYEKEEDYKKRYPRAQLWTKKVYEVISRDTNLANLKLSQVTDADFYCPNYDNMTRRQKVVFWGQLIASISYEESNWNPTKRMAEPLASFPKPDAVTGERVYSEGLLQLSYQDNRTYRNHFDCGFDWNKDKYLKRDSPDKTILAPYRNLRCGILILSRQVDLYKKITTNNQYWSVIRPRATNKYSKTLRIAGYIKKLPFCNVSGK